MGLSNGRKKKTEGGKKKLVMAAGSTMWPGCRNAVPLIHPSVSRTNSVEAEMEMRRRERAGGGGSGKRPGTRQVRRPRTKKKRQKSAAEEQVSVCWTPTRFYREGSMWRPIGGIQDRLTRQDGWGGGVTERSWHRGRSGSRRSWWGRTARSRAWVSLTQPTFGFRTSLDGWNAFHSPLMSSGANLETHLLQRVWKSPRLCKIHSNVFYDCSAKVNSVP